jgi:hypothetical protein
VARKAAFDSGYFMSEDVGMRLLNKIVAVVVMLWLPLFSGNALASSIQMQMPSNQCQDEAMATMPDMEMHDMDMGDQQAAVMGDDHSPACDTCGICHLACSGYVAASEVAPVPLNILGLAQVLNQVSFRSISFAPLTPPPLVRV